MVSSPDRPLMRSLPSLPLSAFASSLPTMVSLPEPPAALSISRMISLLVEVTRTAGPRARLMSAALTVEAKLTVSLSAPPIRTFPPLATSFVWKAVVRISSPTPPTMRSLPAPEEMRSLPREPVISLEPSLLCNVSSKREPSRGSRPLRLSVPAPRVSCTPSARLPVTAAPAVG